PTPEDNSVDKWALLCTPALAPASIHRHRRSPRPEQRSCPHRAAPDELDKRRTSTPLTGLTTATGVLSIERKPHYSAGGYTAPTQTPRRYGGTTYRWEVTSCSLDSSDSAGWVGTCATGC